MHHIKVTPLSVSHSHSNTNSINAQSMYDSIHMHTASICNNSSCIHAPFNGAERNNQSTVQVCGIQMVG